ncbi:hypothetical protein GJAV_G00126910 [Gymnothorax javanicus]|nr:hypothetical protein GJAV_G00126910 [Gymnothorax javanicus]
MDNVEDVGEGLSDFEKGVIFGARLAGASRARAAEIAREASRGPPVSERSSGVIVADDVMAIFKEMKGQRAPEDEEEEGEKKKRKKLVLFRVSDDEGKVVLDEGQQILQGEVGSTITDPYEHFISLLPPEDCRYALYEVSYSTRRAQREGLVFIFWDPESAPENTKMTYDKCYNAMRKIFRGLKHEWRVNSMEDVQNRRILAEKLGAKTVVALEGSPL